MTPETEISCPTSIWPSVVKGKTSPIDRNVKKLYLPSVTLIS
jgi:hypothetical protein